MLEPEETKEAMYEVLAKVTPPSTVMLVKYPRRARMSPVKLFKWMREPSAAPTKTEPVESTKKELLREEPASKPAAKEPVDNEVRVPEGVTEKAEELPTVKLPLEPTAKEEETETELKVDKPVTDSVPAKPREEPRVTLPLKMVLPVTFRDATWVACAIKEPLVAEMRTWEEAEEPMVKSPEPSITRPLPTEKLPEEVMETAPEAVAVFKTEAPTTVKLSS